MRTVQFEFRKVGFNAHSAKSSLTFETEEGARQAAESIKNTEGFFNVELVKTII